VQFLANNPSSFENDAAAVQDCMRPLLEKEADWTGVLERRKVRSAGLAG
jgi:hypothetical protein